MKILISLDLCMYISCFRNTREDIKKRCYLFTVFELCCGDKSWLVEVLDKDFMHTFHRLK